MPPASSSGKVPGGQKHRLRVSRLSTGLPDERKTPSQGYQISMSRLPGNKNEIGILFILKAVGKREKGFPNEKEK